MKTFYIVTREDISGDAIKVAAVCDDLDTARGAMDTDVLDYTAQKESDQVDRFVLIKLTTDDQDMNALLDMSEDKRLSTAQQQEFKEIMRNAVKQILTIFTVQDMMDEAEYHNILALDLSDAAAVREFFMQNFTPFGGRYR